MSTASERATPGTTSHSTKPRRRWLIAGALLLVTTLVGAGGAVVYARRAKPRALPVLASRLPGKTTSLTQARADRVGDSVLLPELTTSRFAEALCGGTDVAAILARARGKSLKSATELGLFKLGDAATRDAMKCGDVLRASLEDQAYTIISFDDGDKHLEVSGIRSSLADVTKLGFTRHTFSGLEGACLHGEDAKSDCPEDRPATFHDGHTWFFGTTAAVEAFARAYTSAHTELTTNVDILGATVAHTDDSDEIVLTAKPEVIPWAEPCLTAAPVDTSLAFTAACFPKGEERVTEAVLSRVRAVAVEHDALPSADAYRYVFVLLARDDDDAKALEKDVGDLARDWRAKVDNDEPDMSKLVRAKSSFVHDAFVQAAFDPFVRALKTMTVTRRGSVVRLVITTPLRPEEKKSLGEFLSTRDEDQRAQARVVTALTTGSPLAEKDLAQFLDPVFARRLVTPRATAKDCTAVLDHLKEVDKDVPAELYGLKFQLEKSFDGDVCVGAPLPAESRTCLVGAIDLKAFVACARPRSLALEIASSKVDGQWGIVDDPKLADVKVEISGTRIAVDLSGTPMHGDMELQSTDGEAISFVLPLPGPGRDPRWEATFKDKDTMILTSKDGAKTESHTLARTTFDSLLAGSK